MSFTLDTARIQKWVASIGSYQRAEETTGIKRGHLNKIANGKLIDISISTLSRLASAMNLSPGELLIDDEHPAPARSVASRTKFDRLQEKHDATIKRMERAFEREKQRLMISQSLTLKRCYDLAEIQRFVVHYLRTNGGLISDDEFNAAEKKFLKLYWPVIVDERKEPKRRRNRNFAYTKYEDIQFQDGNGQCPECKEVGYIQLKPQPKTKPEDQRWKIRGSKTEWTCGCGAEFRRWRGKLICTKRMK